MADMIWSLPLARELSPMISSGGSGTAVGFAVAVAIVIIVFVIGAKVSGGSSRGGGSAKRGGSGTVKKVSLKKQGAALGLTKVQINTIENLLEHHPMANSSSLFRSPALLDKLLQLGMEDIENQVSAESVKEAQKLTLFRIKQIVERNSQKAGSLKASRQFSTGMKFVITPENGIKLPTKVLANLKDSIAVELPKDPRTNNPVKPAKGLPVVVFFWKPNGQGFSFASKVLGYTKVKSTDALLLKHSNNVREAQQRRFRRKELQRPCYFYPVRIITTGIGKKQEKRAMLESNRGSLGTVLEVSSGGCSLKTTYPLAKGELIKVDFETSKQNNVSAYGKVVGFTREKPLGGVMHIQFTRVSQKYLNRINSFVYEL